MTNKVEAAAWAALALAVGGCAEIPLPAARPAPARAASAAAPAAAPRGQIALSARTDRLEGWFRAKGEWALYPTEGEQAKGERRDCVTLVNDTGKLRLTFNGLDGARVVVKGVAKKYDELPTGWGELDLALSRKYYKGAPVENACAQDFVFLATSLDKR